MSLAQELTSQDPTAGETAGDTTAEAGTGTAQQTPERAFTQADVDRIAANERARARRWYERELSQRQPQAPSQQQNVQIDPVTGELQTIKQKMTEFELDGAISSLSKRFPEFGDDKKLREILENVVDMGLDKATHLPISTVLELAFRNWDHQRLVAEPKVDIAKITAEAKAQGVKEYLAKKTGTAAATPRTEGPGGTTAPTGAPSILRGKDMIDYGLEVLRNSGD